MHSIQLAPPRGAGSHESRVSAVLCIRTFLTLVIMLASAADLLAGSPSGNKPRVTLDEFFKSVEFGKVALSPDGHMAAIATERADWDAERFRDDLWLWRDSDGVLIPLTQSGHDSDPMWSPDGKWIAFLSDRDGDGDPSDKGDDDKKDVTHVYLIPIGGGEAFPVTRGAEDVHSFAWSPDSKTLYFATRIPWTTKQKDEYK
jgi:dipeptidyl aminopeptidase/acylaminoacyl peptidase